MAAMNELLLRIADKVGVDVAGSSTAE